jgi:hypothetical protein
MEWFKIGGKKEKKDKSITNLKEFGNLWIIPKIITITKKNNCTGNIDYKQKLRLGNNLWRCILFWNFWNANTIVHAF